MSKYALRRITNQKAFRYYLKRGTLCTTGKYQERRKIMKVKHILIAILVGWILVLMPYFIPALNVSTRIIGIPLTLWLSILAFVLCVVVNEIAFRQTWETFDCDPEESETEEMKK